MCLEEHLGEQLEQDAAGQIRSPFHQGAVHHGRGAVARIGEDAQGGKGHAGQETGLTDGAGFHLAAIGAKELANGALAVLVLLAFLCLRVLAAARRAKDRGGYLICMGVFASLMFQTVENIGMCLGVLPVVGLTLPLFSYGGSSVVSIYLSVGLVQAVTVRARTGSFIVEQQE